MNGRTSDFPDILDFDKYLEDNDLFSNISHIPIRVNKDYIVDSHGRKLLDLCKSSGFITANGRLGDDYGIGEVTYHSTHGVSTVDYLLLHNTDIGSLFNFEVLMPNEYSDHSPLSLSFLKQNHSNVSSDSTSAPQNKIFWESDKEPLFRQHITESLPNLNPMHDANCTINEKVDILSSFLAENSTKVFGKSVNTGNSRKRSKSKTSPWFDVDCRTAKKDFAKARNLYMKQKDDINRQNFVKQRTKYNRIKTKAKQKFKIAECQKLNTEARKRPKKFWRKIKSLRKNKSSKGQNLQVEDLLEHFIRFLITMIHCPLKVMILL